VEVPNRVRASAARRAIWNGVARIAWAKCVGSKKKYIWYFGPAQEQAGREPARDRRYASQQVFFLPEFYSCQIHANKHSVTTLGSKRASNRDCKLFFDRNQLNKLQPKTKNNKNVIQVHVRQRLLNVSSDFYKVQKPYCVITFLLVIPCDRGQMIVLGNLGCDSPHQQIV
jgi:hypothetical protein